MSVAFSTDAPGAPYSPSTAAFTLSAPLSVPNPSNCSAELSVVLTFLQLVFGGNGRLTVSGVLALPGFRYAGAVACNATAPQMSVGAPRVYGHDLSTELVLYRTNFWRLAPTGWQLTSSPFLLSTATAFVRTSDWSDLMGNSVGSTESVVQTAATNPPGGVWVATQEIYWLNGSLQVTDTDQLLAYRASGANALGSFCRWSSAASPARVALPAGVERSPGPVPASARRALRRLQRSGSLEELVAAGPAQP
jgi:hypothetical protein